MSHLCDIRKESYAVGRRGVFIALSVILLGPSAAAAGRWADEYDRCLEPELRKYDECVNDRGEGDRNRLSCNQNLDKAKLDCKAKADAVIDGLPTEEEEGERAGNAS